MSTFRASILEVFRAASEPLSTRMLALRCIEGGVFPDEWMESAGVRAAQEECRGVLKDCVINGLAFAGKTSLTDESGAPLWVQREMWDYATYALNITQYLDKRDQNHGKALLLQGDCRKKFGRAPAVPGLDASGEMGGAAA